MSTGVFIGLQPLNAAINEAFSTYWGARKMGDDYPKDTILRLFAERRFNPLGMAIIMMRSFVSVYDLLSQDQPPSWSTNKIFKVNDMYEDISTRLGFSRFQ